MASVSITTHCLQINPQLILQHQVCLHAIMFLAMNINNRLNLCIVSQTLLSLSFIRDAVVMVSPPSNKTLRQVPDFQKCPDESVGQIRPSLRTVLRERS